MTSMSLSRRLHMEQRFVRCHRPKSAQQALFDAPLPRMPNNVSLRRRAPNVITPSGGGSGVLWREQGATESIQEEVNHDKNDQSRLCWSRRVLEGDLVIPPSRIRHLSHMQFTANSVCLRAPAEPSPPPIKEPPDPPENPDAPVREPDPTEPAQI